MTELIRTSPVTDADRPLDDFVRRHIGPRPADLRKMLETVGCSTLEELIDQTIPAPIRLERPLNLAPPRGEHELLTQLRDLAGQNRVFRSFLGMGYARTIVPPVIQRNILENPGWYTQYTAYQSEISQGRLEALLNFQTMVADLTGLPLANASLLDEATAAAEAMNMCWAIDRLNRHRFFVAEDCHPQTIEVVRTRAKPRGIEVVVAPAEDVASLGEEFFGVLLQVPATDGRVIDPKPLIAKAHENHTLVVVAADILALTMLEPPGEQGADIAVGSTQRFGVPMGFGGPHAAFLATKDEHKRHVPGRIIGVSLDARGKPAYRLAMQTREQHIRRDKATSNICTAQALLAVMAGMYAVYHGPEGLRAIAERTHRVTRALAAGLMQQGHRVTHEHFFDTLRVTPEGLAPDEVLAGARARGINLRAFDDGSFGIALDEPTTVEDLTDLLLAFGAPPDVDVHALVAGADGVAFEETLARRSGYLTHPVFHRHHSEHEMLRYVHRLQSRDLSLTTSMIPLGSCTMKLNGTSEMLPVTWSEFGELHPFAPRDQWEGYARLFDDLETWLAEITGFTAVSLQPNAGAQGEYAGLMVIKAYHESRGDAHRDVCLIPVSAHGTNPASAAMVGMKVVVVACDEQGNVDVDDLRAKSAEHARELAALMITYPSTHGVFEESIQEICAIVHRHGGQVYMDGANMNAQVGLCRPADMGADVCHLNLHKTFCIPHGGGGPGMGPIGVAKHLAPFLPGHPALEHGPHAVGPVSAAPFGSPSILPISWVYIALMGAEGLTRASQVAILNANYMARRLEGAYDILFRGPQGRVAHEFVLDLRPFKASAGIDVTDVAKRLMDYSFHAPTMSWPVAGTLMVEPTESESKEELDRFCDAMLAIRAEIAAIEGGDADRADNVLTNAPHTIDMIAADDWNHPYSREQAAYPLAWLRESKFWPSVARVDNAYGDRHLVCTCPPLEDYASA